jgi:tetratricopeptide (TPR) repeat protein
LTNPDTLAAVLAAVARQRGVPPVAMLAMVATIVKGPVQPAPGALERLLGRKADDFLPLRTRLAQPTADPALARWRAAAAQALEAGQFPEIDKALAQAELQILGGVSDLGAMNTQNRLLAGEARADRAGTSLLELTAQSYREAAKRYGEAAAIIGLADPERSHALALSQADALMRIGEDLAEATGFEAAIAQLRALLSGLDNFDETVPWAATQERLSLALSGLFALNGQVALLQEAASCCRTALEDLRKPQDTTLWARLQRQLGSAALQLGERTGADLGLIEEAVEAFQAAATGVRREHDPEGWARLQYDLGRAQAALGERTGGVANLEAAFNGLQAALDVWTRESDAAMWSDVQDRMGHVLSAMGERYSEPVVLEEAVAAFGRALEERRRDNAPLLWATSSTNQGLATMKLAHRQKDLGLAQQALAQIMAAVEAMRSAGFTANAAELQKKLVEAGALAETLRKR